MMNFISVAVALLFSTYSFNTFLIYFADDDDVVVVLPIHRYSDLHTNINMNVSSSRSSSNSKKNCFLLFFLIVVVVILFISP